MPEPASGTSPAAVRMFGALQLRIRETVLGPGDLGSTKAKQLFEILLLERVAATVEGYVSVLRARLGIAGLIRTDRGGYRLSPEHVSTDVDRFGVLLRARPPRSPSNDARRSSPPPRWPRTICSPTSRKRTGARRAHALPRGARPGTG
jgi:hypothetical protein